MIETAVENAPTYYLDTDAPLYYYSFCDAWIAMQYKNLPKEKQLYVYHLYDRLWKLVGEEVTYKVSIGNYEKLFNNARTKVRAWEKANVK